MTRAVKIYDEHLSVDYDGYRITINSVYEDVEIFALSENSGIKKHYGYHGFRNHMIFWDHTYIPDGIKDVAERYLRLLILK